MVTCISNSAASRKKMQPVHQKHAYVFSILNEISIICQETFANLHSFTFVLRRRSVHKTTRLTHASMTHAHASHTKQYATQRTHQHNTTHANCKAFTISRGASVGIGYSLLLSSVCAHKHKTVTDVHA